MTTKLLCSVLATLAWMALGLAAASGAGSENPARGADSLLPPCPGTPNCVCSDDPDPARRIDPLVLAAAPEKAWGALRELLSSLPRVTVVRADGSMLQAEARSRLFGFVDDLAFQLRPARGIIAVRSAARTGYYDMGVNRRRVEEIRRRLRAAGVVE